MSEPDWPKIITTLEANPVYQAALAEAEAAEQEAPPEETDWRALVQRLRSGAEGKA